MKKTKVYTLRRKSDAVAMLWRLAFVPHTHVEYCWGKLQKAIMAESAKKRDVQGTVFCKYMDKIWIGNTAEGIKPRYAVDTWNKYKVSLRTNNLQERWHRTFKEKIGKGLNLAKFV
jgi:hypothetical protein